MPFGRVFRRLLQLPGRSAARIARDVDDEVTFHLDMRTRELIAAGVPPAEARGRARREFGDVEHARDALRRTDGGFERERRRATVADEMAQDVRYAVRQLGRNPMFTAVSVLTLAIAIGSNTAIFSTVHAVLLEQLPFAEPDRLMRIWSDFRGRHSASSVPDYLDFRRQSRAFAGIATSFETTANLSGAGEPERLTGQRVSANLFPILGVKPLLGRLFVEADDDERAPRVVVLGEGFWRRRFGGDPAIIGRSLTMDARPTEVIGVVATEGQYPAAADVWMTTRFDASERDPKMRGARWLRVIGRLAPGVTQAQGEAELKQIAAHLAQDDPKHNTDYSVVTLPLLESEVGSLRVPLLVLLGAVGFVVLIACANVAALMLGRTSARETEMAVRAALGAGRSRIVRQLLTESLLLSFVGATIGVGLATWGTRLLQRLAPGDVPRIGTVHLDGVVLAYTLAVAVVTGLLFGLAPALHASASQLQSRLKEGMRGAGGRSGAGRTRSVLVVTELALSITLLIGAGLLLRSFSALRDVDPGFRPSRLSAFTVSLPAQGYEPLEKQRAFVSTMTGRLQRLPGVQSASASFGLPLSDSRFSISFKIAGRPEPPPNDEPTGQIRVATPDYFRAMGIPLLRGCGFTEQDRWETPQVVLVSKELARRYFPNEDPIGKHIEAGWGREGHFLGGEIIGVVGDVKQFGLGSETVPFYYTPFDQWPLDEITFVLKSALPPATLIASSRAVLKEIDPTLPLFDALTIGDLVARSLAQPRFYLFLLAAFSAVALILAAVGVYGVVAYSVQRRTREFGLRMALGASSSRVLRGVLRDGLVLTAVGVTAGLAGAWAVTRLLQSLLFGVSPTDPITFSGVAVLLGVVATVACYVPARRATRADPQTAMRAE